MAAAPRIAGRRGVLAADAVGDGGPSLRRRSGATGEPGGHAVPPGPAAARGRRAWPVGKPAGPGKAPESLLGPLRNRMGTGADQCIDRRSAVGLLVRLTDGGGNPAAVVDLVAVLLRPGADGRGRSEERRVGKEQCVAMT